MSIVRTVLRLVTVAALNERTWAEDRVFDSDNTPLDEILRENDAPKPYIVVYTDMDDKTEVSGTDVYGADRLITLVMEIAVASKIKMENAEAAEVYTPHTDPGMEIAVDLTEGQAMAALLGDTESEWGEIFKLLVHNIVRISTRRGGRGEHGVRWAARQISLQCKTIDDVPPGVILSVDHPIRKFITLARTLDDATGFPDAADLIDGMLNIEASPTWKQNQAWLGLTRRGIRSTGIAPLADDASMIQPTETPDSLVDDDGEGPALTEGTVENEDEENVSGTVTEEDPEALP